jgi:uncharacterized alkaline shock family protein YloU
MSKSEALSPAGDAASLPPPRPELGEVRINNELLSTVVCHAALETPGVVWISGKRSALEIQNRKEIDRFVTVTTQEPKRASVQLEVNVEYGYNIYETMRRMQRSVKNAIEHMSGFAVDKVDVLVREVVPRSTPVLSAGRDAAGRELPPGV